MQGLEQIKRQNADASKIITAPRNLANAATAELVESVSGKSRKQASKPEILAEASA